MAPGLRNVYGLPIRAAFLLNKNQSWTVPSGGTVGPLDTRVLYLVSEPQLRLPEGCFLQTDEPVLQTDSYYFFAGDPSGDLPNYAVPGSAQFNISLTTPLLVTSWGKPIVVGGWAKQMIVNGFSTKAAYLQQYFDKAYKADSNGNRTTVQTGILSEYGEYFPTEPGHVILTTKSDPDQNNLQGEAHLYVIKMSVDLNHDGTMDETISGPDNTSADKPFTFWVNNDWDISDPVGSPGRDVTGYVRDSDDDFIESQRDLEDFARLWISGMPALPINQGYSVTLSISVQSGNPAINVFNSVESDGGTRYLTDTGVATAQLAGPPFTGPAWKVASISSSQSFTFPSTYFTSGGKKYFLFEGAGIGKGELVLTIYRGADVLAKTSVFIDLRDVKDMFEHVHIENVTDSSPNAFLSTYKEDNFVDTSFDEDKKLIVFVHGWRMGQWDYENFSQTMFKRFYWQGYHGRFVSIRWPTLSKDDFKLPILDFFTYNKSEFRGYKSARGVSDYLNHLKQRLPDYSLNVCSHSMGGIVMMEALKRDLSVGRRSVDNYMSMQAAVPAHCYDTTIRNYEAFLPAEQAQPTPDTYRGYPGAINAAVGNRIVDFYNVHDYALAAGPAGNWEANQITYKPNLSFGYSSDGTHGFLDGVLVTENRELMSFVSRPRSKAVGAQPGVGGVIYALGQIDLTSGFNFQDGSDLHSAQFNWSIQRLNGFYRQLGISLGVVSPPTP